MKITNLDKGKAYQLGEDAKLEVERTNPFFNDYGETTSPLDIPASDYNRMILNYPDTFGMRDKMVATNVSIEDGEYFAQCRQIVLSAQQGKHLLFILYQRRILLLEDTECKAEERLQGRDDTGVHNRR